MDITLCQYAFLNSSSASSLSDFAFDHFESTNGRISGNPAARRDAFSALPSLRLYHLYVNVVVSIKYKSFCVGMRRTVLEANKRRSYYFGEDFFFFFFF